jgi:hypothetical protein
MSSHLGLILHVQEGNNSPYGWFSNPESQDSSTWWVSKTGVTQCFVAPASQAWAQGAGNATYNSVETEGYTTEALTDPQMSALAEIYEWGMATYHWPAALANAPGVPGFGTHAMGGAAWGNHPGCPGNIRANQRQAVLDLIGRPTQEDEMFVAGTPSGKGYYCLRSDGSVFAYGDAKYSGGVNNAGPGGTSALPAGDSCTSLSICASGGYWVATAQDNLYAFGGAPFLGKP